MHLLQLYNQMKYNTIDVTININNDDKGCVLIHYYEYNDDDDDDDDDRCMNALLLLPNMIQSLSDTTIQGQHR